ncbi:MAG: PIN domain-containing protein [Smithellaceae bacterium]|nr:PIN domain-containing protein [Smithellaceae bacterium]
MLNAHQIHKGRGIKSSIIIDSNVIIDTFDPSSPNHSASCEFMDHILSRNILFAMPMHGLFEINCTLNRIKKEKGIVPPILAGRQQMAIEIIHIDDQFLDNYCNVDVPVIRAMDHLFLVVAKKNYLPLITWDKRMTLAGNECGVNVFNPAEWMEQARDSQRSTPTDPVSAGR